MSSQPNNRSAGADTQPKLSRRLAATPGQPSAGCPSLDSPRAGLSRGKRKPPAPKNRGFACISRAIRSACPTHASLHPEGYQSARSLRLRPWRPAFRRRNARLRGRLRVCEGLRGFQPCCLAFLFGSSPRDSYSRPGLLAGTACLYPHSTPYPWLVKGLRRL